jgi:hypothetical protein
MTTPLGGIFIGFLALPKETLLAMAFWRKLRNAKY